jgi:lysozyme
MRFEGFHRVPQSAPLRRAHPYVCPAGYWTIGWGHLCQPDHPPVTEAEAENYLTADLVIALAATLRYCPVLLNQPENRLAATVDFTFWWWGRTSRQTQRTGLVFAANGCCEEQRKPPT